MLPGDEEREQHARLMRGPTGHDERLVPEVADPANLVYSLKRYYFAQPYCLCQRVLDAAPGTGYGASILAQSAKRVFGIDYDQNVIDYARSPYGSGKLDFLVGDVTSLPFQDEMFDVVVSFETIEHLYDQKRQLNEVRRVLRSDGVFLISTSNAAVAKLREKITFRKVEAHIGGMGARDFRMLLSRFFTVVAFWGMSLKGSAVYSFLRFFDVFSLRLYLIRWKAALDIRSSLLGTMPIQQLDQDGIVISRWQLRQASHFLAVCRKNERKWCPERRQYVIVSIAVTVRREARCERVMGDEVANTSDDRESSDQLLMDALASVRAGGAGIGPFGPGAADRMEVASKSKGFRWHGMSEYTRT